MESVYQTLIARALQISQSQQQQQQQQPNTTTGPVPRTIISLSGPPGAGKSTIAATVIARLNALASKPFAIALPIDGFHYPRKYLDGMTKSEEAHARRGAHWTFDAKGALQLVKALHSSKAGQREVIYAPEFDHAGGDPVEGAIAVSPEISLILIEGNYLAYNRSPWSEMGDYVDDTWFVDVDVEVARRRIAQRHLDSGIEKTMEEALRRVESNDMLNNVDIHENLIKPAVVVYSVDEP
ncbi:P-loop containing nucleoside triphosphate hydrolase protein [Aspergillus sclerotioniger CBS 115572]|uniref:P-loop containing nucleoside triphosphate hydrolase protein n=1 Tax=Aspergillus sclerotioniger CBS 115572 TaxID=1450535 RepID=A0A317XA09_9EURO|nr:P-loop containing nucleoside triphosphate hydrolase protein [Aspergillus sclerotioniger CBS 115572]PWY95414.1 P-loop containing nucleoside triphosphate hydrolase protein [Aspergillus sclerotioniger CBS 115572]